MIKGPKIYYEFQIDIVYDLVCFTYVKVISINKTHFGSCIVSHCHYITYVRELCNV